jgi:DNA-directed RNA polymerase beta subunit
VAPPCGLDQSSPTHTPTRTQVFVNGGWVGIHHQPDKLVQTLRAMRRGVDISAEVSIVRDIQVRSILFLIHNLMTHTQAEHNIYKRQP